MSARGTGGRLPVLLPGRLDADATALRDRLCRGRLAKAPFAAIGDDGGLLGPFNVFLHAPRIAGGFLDFHEAEEAATPLSSRMREVVILSVGAVWRSPYELYAHRAVAGRTGLSREVVEALAVAGDHDELTGEERAVQLFFLTLMGDGYVSDEVYAAAERAIGREGLVAAVFLAAAYGGTCVLLNAFAVPAPPAPAG